MYLQVDFQEYDYIFGAVNEGQNHWILLVCFYALHDRKTPKNPKLSNVLIFKITIGLIKNIDFV